MTCTPGIEKQLQQLAAQGGTARDRATFELGEGQTLELTRTVVERLGCSFEQLSLRSAAATETSSERLQQVAEALSRRLVYLLEPVCPVEIDAEACSVQMRSMPPSRDDAGTCYYELLVRPGRISLCRYRKIAGHQRALIPATLTHEAFCRLVKDLAAAMG